MKKALKFTGKVLLGLLILFAIFLIIMMIYNQIMLQMNKDLYKTPLGQLIEVDGHNMSIYTEGEGEHTIVFMSGWGTASPILDFKPLYSRLSDQCRIVVIEKFGYGFSDIVGGERSFDEINAAPLPTVPMLMYLSTDSVQSGESWENGTQAMVRASENGQLIKLNCGHYVHDYEYERISTDMKLFIDHLND